MESAEQEKPRRAPTLSKEEKRENDSRRDVAYFTEMRRMQVANAAKTARLRALRLAKEATDREHRAASSPK